MIINNDSNTLLIRCLCYGHVLEVTNDNYEIEKGSITRICNNCLESISISYFFFRAFESYLVYFMWQKIKWW